MHKGKGKGFDNTNQMKGNYGKAGGKSSPKAAGKGRKGPLGGCWLCGGDHFAADCGKGAGGRAYTLGDYFPGDWAPEEAAETRQLGSLIERPVAADLKITAPSQPKSASPSSLDVPDAEGWTEVVRGKKNQRERKRRMCVMHHGGACEHECGSGCEGGHGKIQQVGVLAPFMTIEPEGFNTVDCHEEWEQVEMAVDSGASETVLSVDQLQGVELKEGAAYRRGVQYEVANGVRIPNLGEKVFKGVTAEGLQRTITSQVCEVNKSLLSVSKCVKAGNRVVFDEEEAYIEDKKTGDRMWLEATGGMYALKLWVRKTGF